MNRRDEILSVANQMFQTQGYDQTSTNDIIKEIGIARGTLYHHFSSKEAILDGLIEKQGQTMLNNAEEIALNHSIPVMERLFMIIQTMDLRQGDGYILDQMHAPQNALMHEKSNRLLFQRLPKIMNIVVTDGIEQGIMASPHPCQACEMVLAYVITYIDSSHNQVSQEQQIEQLQGLLYHLELLFGTSSGAFQGLMKLIQEGSNE